MRATRFGPRAAQALTTKRLHAHYRPGHGAVDVHIANMRARGQLLGT